MIESCRAKVQVTCYSLVLLLPSVSCSSSNSDDQTQGKTRIEIFEEEALAFFDSTTQIDSIVEGQTWTEGPLYIDSGNYFLFSDIPQNRIYRWDEFSGKRIYLEPSGYTALMDRERHLGSNGLILHPDGSLVLMQQGDRRIASMDAPLSNPQPNFVTIVDRFEGKRLNSPNDGVYHANGDLYFTDPPYGLDRGNRDSTRQLDFHGVFRLKPGGTLDLLTREFNFPNGIALSPDGNYLFVAHSDPKNMIWMKYELNTDGLIGKKQVFYDAHDYEGEDLGAPDGMAMHSKGYLFATGPEGLWLFNPKGRLIARIYTGQLTSNCTLSGYEDMLFMTCDDYIMRMKLKKL